MIVAHKDGEYSSYAHLTNFGIRVNKGDKVKRGQILAQIGLSGDGYEPHLHFQITDGPDIEDCARRFRLSLATFGRFASRAPSTTPVGDRFNPENLFETVD